LDTRTKIVSAEQARSLRDSQSTRFYAGHFDPLLAAHARVLGAIAAPGQQLIVEVTNPPAPLLSQRARAELVAGLACVDYVVLGQMESPGDETTRQFIQHVCERVNGAAH